MILIAGHGTVDGKNAYILTYDADPQDLASTALPMSEVANLFQDQVKKVGRVLLFVRRVPAGTIGTIQSTTVNSDVQHLGDAEGDLFGLLASRTKELSRRVPSSAAATVYSVITWSKVFPVRPMKMAMAWSTPTS